MKSTKQFFKFTLLLVLTSFFIVSCSKDLAVVQTMEVTSVTNTTAVSGGIITDDKGEVVEAKGICWSESPNPTTGDFTSSVERFSTTGELLSAGAGSFVCTMTGLTAGTTYYVRAYAETKNGVAYGSNMVFTTTGGNTQVGTVTDVDGNTYTTITIGSQTWMTENLKVTKFRNGTAIPQVTSDNSYWSTTTTGAWGVYKNDNTNKITYGLLYNWYAVTNENGLAPQGWHIASDAEWTILENYLGGYAAAEAKLKSANSWSYTVGNGTNASGFNALPAGYNFMNVTQTAAFWTSTSTSIPSSAITREYGVKSTQTTSGTMSKSSVLSVRCIKD